MPLSRPLVELRSGIYEHYKSTPDNPKHYLLLGLAVFGEADKCDLFVDLGPLRYTEDETLGLNLYRPPVGEHPYPFLVAPDNCDRDHIACSALRNQVLVMYWACYGNPYERKIIKVRPARGKDGFLTPAEVDGKLQMRFTYLGPWMSTL